MSIKIHGTKACDKARTMMKEGEKIQLFGVQFLITEMEWNTSDSGELNGKVNLMQIEYWLNQEAQTTHHKPLDKAGYSTPSTYAENVSTKQESVNMSADTQEAGKE